MSFPAFVCKYLLVLGLYIVHFMANFPKVTDPKFKSMKILNGDAL